MPTYYFDIVAPAAGRVTDPEGDQLCDLEAARTEAALCAREVVAHDLLAGKALDLNRSIAIRDTAGSVVEVLSFVTACRAAPMI